MTHCHWPTMLLEVLVMGLYWLFSSGSSRTLPQWQPEKMFGKASRNASYNNSSFTSRTIRRLTGQFKLYTGYVKTMKLKLLSSTVFWVAISVIIYTTKRTSSYLVKLLSHLRASNAQFSRYQDYLGWINLKVVQLNYTNDILCLCCIFIPSFHC